MTNTSEPAAGEHWAYRVSRSDPFAEVVVVRRGVKTPPRVLIRFVEDAFEGRQDWVPPGRLKAPWAEADAFLAREHRWDAVAASTPDDEPLVTAASVVFDLLINPELAELGYNATEGVITVHDAAGLAALLAVPPDELRSDPASFEEDGDLVASWLLTERVVRRAAERDPHTVLRYVEHDEADALRESVSGRWYSGRGRALDHHVSAEICAHTDEEFGRPLREILRQWCGSEPSDIRREIAALRKEAGWLRALAEAALAALRAADQSRTAARLERDFGPVRGGERRVEVRG